MLNRRKGQQNGGEMGGQDSFLDIVSNIVGILIILVMIAGVRAQNSSPEIVKTEPEVVKTVDRETLETLETKYVEFKEKEDEALRARFDIDTLKEEVEAYEEQIALQNRQHAELFDVMTTARAALEIAAEDKDQTTRDKIEAQRQIQELDVKLQQISKTKEWIASNRPKATVLENIPTPISKTLGDKEKEAHFRLLGGRISYVPIPELRQALDIEYAQNKERYHKQKLSDGKLGPIDGWYCEFLLVNYDVPMRGPYGGGIASRLEIDLVEFKPVTEPAGEPLKSALSSPQSDLITKLKYFRQDVYTITVWVYPDSFEEYREFKKILHEQGYQVAARPLEFGETISGSPRGSKSSAQ